MFARSIIKNYALATRVTPMTIPMQTRNITYLAKKPIYVEKKKEEKYNPIVTQKRDFMSVYVASSLFLMRYTVPVGIVLGGITSAQHEYRQYEKKDLDVIAYTSMASISGMFSGGCIGFLGAALWPFAAFTPFAIGSVHVQDKFKFLYDKKKARKAKEEKVEEQKQLEESKTPKE